MKEMIRWLRDLEHLASGVYFKAAEYFKNDKEISKFLNRSAEDEAWHYHVMVSAEEHFRRLKTTSPCILLDRETKQRVESIFHEIDKKLTDKTLTKAGLIDSLIEVEFSEWNHLFLYVVNKLKEHFREFSYVAIRIQNHKRAFEYFCEKFFENVKKIDELKQVPAVWKEKILIVEDDESIAGLLKAILNEEGNIDIVGNGLQGLEKVKEHYYKLIISDVDMPVMNGIEFYEQASKNYMNINQRFLFFTGRPSTERVTFFKEQRLEFIPKPSDISKIQEKALTILLNQNKEIIKNKFV